jgi:hypothetical protein
MSSDAGSIATVPPLALVPTALTDDWLSEAYQPRRLIVDGPTSIAPRRAVSYLNPGSAPSRVATVSAAIQAALEMPVFPELTWTDLAREQELDGESAGGRLNQLRADGWQVLHSVSIGTRGTAIDHVLVGPGGVFLINNQTNSPTATGNSRLEAERAAKFLSGAVGWPVQVTPVSMADAPMSPHYGQEGVLVLGRTEVPGYFRRRPVQLIAADVAEVYEYARRSSTWC